MTLFLLFSSTHGHSEPFSALHYRNQLIATAQSQKLWTQRGWRKILLIPDTWLNTDQSLIDDPKHFINPDGRSNPEKEMIATLNGFFSNDLDQNTHALCRYPARFQWLAEALSIDVTLLPQPQCEHLQNYSNSLHYVGATLVFSNYYMNNPASLFGHSFLRMKRPLEKRNDKSLMDDVVNFSAFLPEDPGPFIPIKGLMGMFPGKFALLPYYSKIQEYNNSESRDLWEYDLNLTESELRMLELMLWELGPTSIDYYFLDDNCSFVMLSLLEAVRPSLNLTGRFKLYAVPSDTVRAVADVPGMVEAVHYRPSSLSRYRSRFELLTPAEQTLMETIVSNNAENPSIWNDCPKECQARVIDAGLEFIDFKEKLSGSAIPEKFAKLRGSLLIRRAQTGIQTRITEIKPQSSQPTIGHIGNALALGAGYGRDDKPILQLRWKPALHELAENSEGYSDAMSISFLDNSWEIDGEKSTFNLKSLHIVEITFIPEEIPLIPQLGWHIDTGYKRNFGFGSAIDQGLTYLKGGAGPSAHVLDSQALIFAYAGATLGAADRHGLSLAQYLSLGAMLELGKDFKLVFHSDLTRYHFTQTSVDSVENQVDLSYFAVKNLNYRLTAKTENGQKEAIASIYLYF